MRVNLKGDFLLWVFLHLNICVMTMGAVKFMSFLVFLMGPTSLTTGLPHTHLHWHKIYIKWRWIWKTRRGFSRADGCSHICSVTMGAVKFMSALIFFFGVHLFNPRFRTSASGHFHGWKFLIMTNVEMSRIVYRMLWHTSHQSNPFKWQRQEWGPEIRLISYEPATRRDEMNSFTELHDNFTRRVIGQHFGGHQSRFESGTVRVHRHWLAYCRSERNGGNVTVSNGWFGFVWGVLWFQGGWWTDSTLLMESGQGKRKKPSESRHLLCIVLLPLPLF